MALVDRVKAILLTPKTEWPVIEGETENVAGIYKNYLIYLAAIPAVASFIGMSVIGIGGFGFSYRVGFVSGLMNGIVHYVLALVMFYVLSMIVDALAPTFGGTKNQLNAFKVVAYGSTAAMVAGIFSLVPSLSVLGFLGSLYSIYLFYLGLPVLMKCPQEKALPYTAVVIVCGFIAGLVLGWASHMFGGPGRAMMGDAGGSGSVSIRTPGGEVKIDQGKIAEATKKLEEASKKMEEAGKKAEAAGKSGDPAAAGKAVAEAMAALSGAAGGREPIPSENLKALLPESLGDMKRESFEAQGGAAMGIKGSNAKAEYRNGDRSVKLEITDMGGLAGLMAVAGWANVTGEKENQHQIEKVYKSGDRTIREKVDKSTKDAEYTVLLPNGVIVQADGRGVELPALKKIVEGVDLDKLQSAKG
jgi:hypothetical protein